MLVLEVYLQFGHKSSGGGIDRKDNVCKYFKSARALFVGTLFQF